MKTSYLAASLIAAVLAAASLAYSAPGQVTQLKTSREFASVVECDSNSTECVRLFAETDTDNNGALNASINLETINNNGDFAFFICSGPAYANVVSVNPGNGRTNINATLDPASPDCFAFTSSNQTVTVNLSGQYDGLNHTSQNGTGTAYTNGETKTKFNVQADDFGELFTGTIGLISGTFAGSAHTDHNTNLTQVK